MNRAVPWAAGLSLLILLICGAWLLWHSPAPARVVAPGGPTGCSCNKSNFAAAPIATVVPANVPAASESHSNSQPLPEATPEKASAPGQPKPDFRRAPGAARSAPIEVERKKFVSALISGRVIDAGFSPVEGADVYCEVIVQRRYKGVADDESSSLAKVSTSSGDGTFSFTVEREIFESASMTIYVSARCRGYAPAMPAQVDASAGGSFSCTLSLRAGGSVRGRVVDAQGVAVAGVKVALGKQATAAERSARAGDYFEAVTETDGTYALDDVPQGVHRIGVLSLIHNYRRGPTEAVISDTPLTLEDIVVEVVISIRLRVVEAGGAKLHGPCTLSFRENGNDKQRLAGFVTGDGLIELAHPPLGTFDVFIKVEGCFESASQRLTFSLGQITDAGTFTVSRDPDYVKQR